MSHRFLSAERMAVGMVVQLSEPDSLHLNKVLRLKQGEAILLLDGKGGVGEATITESHSKRSRAEIVRVRQVGRPSEVHVAFAIPKGPALEFLLHRLTEVGVAGFQPLITQFSLHPKEWNESRWRKVIEETCKQCEETFFPEISAPLGLTEWLKSRDPNRALVFCHEARRASVAENAPKSGSLELLVGAEGGWSGAENDLVMGSGAFCLGLGKNRLRAETAALVGLTVIKLKRGEIAS